MIQLPNTFTYREVPNFYTQHIFQFLLIYKSFFSSTVAVVVTSSAFSSSYTVGVSPGFSSLPTYVYLESSCSSHSRTDSHSAGVRSLRSSQPSLPGVTVNVANALDASLPANKRSLNLEIRMQIRLGDLHRQQIDITYRQVDSIANLVVYRYNKKKKKKYLLIHGPV